MPHNEIVHDNEWKFHTANGPPRKGLTDLLGVLMEAPSSLGIELARPF